LRPSLILSGQKGSWQPGHQSRIFRAMSQSRRPLTSTRRTLLGGLAAFPFRASAAVSQKSFFAAHNLPIGIQLYVLDGLLDSDLEGSLKALSHIGYREVESAGFAGRSPAQFKTALAAAGLKCVSAHLPATSQKANELSLSSDPADLTRAIAVLGLEAVVLPMFSVPARLASPKPNFMENAVRHLTQEDWKKTAEFLNARGRVVRAAGARLAYHCHNPEYYPGPGGTGLDLLARNTDPNLVDFEIDIGWAAAAGRDPAQVLSSLHGRVRMIHVKDLKPTPVNYWLQMKPANLGEGIVDWKRILPIAYQTGVRHFLVEQEPPYPAGRMQAAQSDFAYLDGLTI
jgi:sugar phosphate isomerase/epimerase